MDRLKLNYFRIEIVIYPFKKYTGTNAGREIFNLFTVFFNQRFL
ncbi:hypothetical protein SAMN05421841_2238 [Chryseobacterium wanjuense]|uniref:Uncharacterized protein n=1 Tax=Chryseobacterium wanjuense TaxID=356305 RepID=A0A1I0QVT6_9FLAO|nr:hypothetical protein SAMN05421841_2238 [Chryseobacterium wanjuense]